MAVKVWGVDPTVKVLVRFVELSDHRTKLRCCCTGSTLTVWTEPTTGWMMAGLERASPSSS